MRKLNKLIVVLWPGYFREFEFYKYELNFLNKFYKIEVHNLFMINKKNFSRLFSEKFKKKNFNILSFNNFTDWKTKMKNHTKNKRVFVISFLSFNHLSAFKYFNYLNNENIKVLEFLNFGFPEYSLSKYERNIFFYIDKIKSIILRPIWSLQTLNKILSLYIFKFILFYKIKKNNFFILCTNKNNLTKTFKKRFSVINGNSWDYSSTLIKDSIKKKTPTKRYAVFLANPGPAEISDSAIMKQKYFTNQENYFTSLNFFLKQVERKYNIPIYIALHPKVKNKNQRKFYKRKTFYGLTKDLVKNSEFVISTTSTGISYPLIYNKTLVIIYSDDYNNDPRLKKMTFFICDMLGIKKFNIDNFDLPNKKMFLQKINQNIIYKFKKNYLSSERKKIPNFEIIKNII